MRAGSLAPSSDSSSSNDFFGLDGSAFDCDCTRVQFSWRRVQVGVEDLLHRSNACGNKLLCVLDHRLLAACEVYDLAGSDIDFRPELFNLDEVVLYPARHIGNPCWVAFRVDFADSFDKLVDTWGTHASEFPTNSAQNATARANFEPSSPFEIAMRGVGDTTSNSPN